MVAVDPPKKELPLVDIDLPKTQQESSKAVAAVDRCIRASLAFEPAEQIASLVVREPLSPSEGEERTFEVSGHPIASCDL